MKYALLIFLFPLFVMGKTAPPFQGELLSGGRLSLNKILSGGKNQRLLLLSFWATWCQPCLQELKTLSQKMKENPRIPLEVVTINVDTAETSSDLKPTVKLYGFNFPVITDPKHDIFSKYQEAKNLPFSVLINPNGEILETFTGYSEEMFSSVQKRVEKINVASP